MTDYISVPNLPRTQNPQRQAPSYGRPDVYGQGNSIPRVTRVSYSTTGAGTIPNRPSWGTNAFPASRPDSTPLHAPPPSDQSYPRPSLDPLDARSRKPSRGYGQPSPNVGDVLSLPPSRPWTAAGTDIGRPTASWISSSYAAHPESILAPDSPYPLHPPPSRFSERDARSGEQRRPQERVGNEAQQEPRSYFEDHDTHAGQEEEEEEVSHSSVAESMSVPDADQLPDPGPQSSFIPDDEPPRDPRTPSYTMVDNVWTLPEPEKQPGFGKRFVGGFVAGFKRIPKAMSKSTNRDVEPTPMPVSFNDNIKLAPAALHYDKPPYQIHQPTNIPHERIHPPDSRHASSTTPSTQSSSMLAPASPPNLPAPRDPPPTLQPALPNPYAPPAELHTPAYIASPVEVHPRHASDYDAMSEPSSDLRQPSLNTRANQVGAFVKEFSHLPWINNRVATEYDPGQSHRAQEAQKHKKSGSWYTKRGQQRLDLLETPSHPKPMRTRDIFAEPHESKNPRSHSHSRSRPHRNHTAASDVVTAIRPSRTPASATSGGVVPTSPGASSHGRGSHAYSYSYYYSNPQPLYVYPAAVSPPRRPDANLNSGSQELQQALPVYMLAAPGPLVLPASPNHRSSGRHHRSNHHPKSTSPPNNSRNV